MIFWNQLFLLGDLRYACSTYWSAHVTLVIGASVARYSGEAHNVHASDRSQRDRTGGQSDPRPAGHDAPRFPCRRRPWFVRCAAAFRPSVRIHSPRSTANLAEGETVLLIDGRVGPFTHSSHYIPLLLPALSGHPGDFLDSTGITAKLTNVSLIILIGYAIHRGGNKCLHRSASLLQPYTIHHSNGM